MKKIILMFALGILPCFGADYYIESPWTAAQLDDIQTAQLNDVMYLVHPDVQPQKLSRLAADNWTLEAVQFDTGPFMVMNDTPTTITPSARTGEITLTASEGIFDDGHVGSIWKIDQKRGSNVYQGTINANESGKTTYFFTGTYSFITEGTFDGTITLERSEDNSTWESALVPLNQNFNNPGESEEDGAYYRVTGSNWDSGTCNYTITIHDNYNHGIVEITGYTSESVVTATVLKSLYNTSATTRWFEPCFSDYRGWPRAICFYQQRLLLAGTYYEPTKIWGSKSYEPENFSLGDGLANDAMDYNITIARQNPILWMYDLDTLIVGTNGGIFRWGNLEDGGGTLTPDNPTSRRLSGCKASTVVPSFVNESLLFVERGGHKVNELAYKLEADGYVVSDLMLLASHIARYSPITETAVQTRPYPILWCVREDGELLGMTFLKQQGIIAWHRQVTDGLVESVCVIPGTDEDEVWLVVQRTIGGEAVRYIERLKPFNWGDDADDCWFVDCGVKYDGDSTSTITGLSHLEGETVQVFKGDSFETAVVSGGAITLSEPVAECTIGLPYTSTLTTMPLEIQDQSGYSIGRLKRVTQMFVAFENSMKFEYSETTKDTFWPVTLENRTDILTPTTGYRPMLNFTGIDDYQVGVTLRQQWPYPMEILAIYPQIDYAQ